VWVPRQKKSESQGVKESMDILLNLTWSVLLCAGQVRVSVARDYWKIKSSSYDHVRWKRMLLFSSELRMSWVFIGISLGNPFHPFHHIWSITCVKRILLSLLCLILSVSDQTTLSQSTVFWTVSTLKIGSSDTSDTIYFFIQQID
jgi:hypothetical protein